MANKKRLWTDFPPEYLTVVKGIATAPLPVLCGPYPLGEASSFRRSFYRFRDALRDSLPARDGSQPARLYEQIEILSAKIEPSSDVPSEYDVIFYLDPMIVEAYKIDPARAQARTLSRTQFAVAQRIPTVSTPMFSNEEMEERIRDMVEEK